MSFLTRSASLMRSAALRPALSAAPRARQQVRFGTTDYGSGAGNPAGERPEKQGKNRSEPLEHPGPPPPKVAEGKSSSSPNEDSLSGSNSQQKSSLASESQSNGGDSKSSKTGAQPKILNERAPPKEEQSEDVRRHNEEMDQRTEKKHQQASKEDDTKDKVPKKFWAGKSAHASAIGYIAKTLPRSRRTRLRAVRRVKPSSLLCTTGYAQRIEAMEEGPSTVSCAWSSIDAKSASQLNENQTVQLDRRL